MAKGDDRLTAFSVKVGTTLGKAEKKRQMQQKKLADAGVVAKEELEEIAKQVEGLKKQLAKTTERLKKALQ